MMKLVEISSKVVIEFALDAVHTALTGGAFGIFKLMKLGFNLCKEINELFREAKRSAKLAGILLACSLAIGFPFYSQTISLVGFSLGG